MNFTALVDSIRQAHAQCAAQANRATVRKPRAPRPARPAPVLTGRFAALDFETADYGRDSACALSVVIVDHGQVVDTWTRLIRPPRQGFVFTYLHGISWRDVHDQPTFGDLWPEAAKRMEGVDFVAAHNASFDRSVLRRVAEAADARQKAADAQNNLDQLQRRAFEAQLQAANDQAETAKNTRELKALKALLAMKGN